LKILHDARSRAAEITPPDWAGEPSPLGALRGRVVLVDFFSLGDPEGVRALRGLGGLSDHYAAAGLTVVGVHVPAYDFERPFERARAEIYRLGVPYSVALDHGFETVRNYPCRDLPARALVDASGFLRAWPQGPGSVPALEHGARHLLREHSPGVALAPPLSPYGPGLLRFRPTPEIRFGARGVGFGPPFDEEPPQVGDVRRFGEPPDVRPQGVAHLEGAWRLANDRIVAEEDGARVAVVYEGTSIHAVVSLDASAGGPVPLTITRDGEPPPAHELGADATLDGDAARVSVDGGRVYELISTDAFGVHHLSIEAVKAGTALHLVEFGSIDVPEEV